MARRELRALFRSPLAWLILAGASFVLAWVFLVFLQQFLEVSPRLPADASAPGVSALVGSPSLLWASLVLVILTPLIAMRLIAEEKRGATLTLLRSAPVSTAAIVVGKFSALIAFLWLVVVIAVAMPLTLALGTALDFGRVASGALGLALLAAAFGAISLFMSTLTHQPLLAALASFGALIFLWIINLAANGAGGTAALVWLAFQPHLAPFLRGEIRTNDVAYFVILAALFLGLSIWKLDAERLGA
ncbi:MAG TPA: ABC transporter permease subunit [Gammaproteobacteria bacterium]|nr:ABC transporter permease subunit [Gammaproteobacteria bacterium]